MKIDERLEHYRIATGRMASPPGAIYGMFHNVPGPQGDKLTIMVAGGDETGWEHVSVSKRRHPPSWVEMNWVKDLCWDTEDCVVQFHPPHSRYVNNYSVVLHMWRCIGAPFPAPPDILVGYKELGELA